MGYMGGGSIGIEYPFEGNSNHYQLWKPPNGYFPRGEAPPPYEEAVALAQAENMNTQCTVSVATTTHRTLPIGINPIDNPANESQPNLTTSTTNLINININNAGNLTAVATGENHQTSYSPCNMLSSSNQPRSTQTHSNCSSSSSCSIGEPSNLLAVRNQTNQICVQPAPLQIQQNGAAICNSTAIQQPQNNQQFTGLMVECTYKNCTLNSKVISSKGHKNHTQDNGTQRNHSNSNTEVVTLERSSVADSMNEVSKTATILPPPLFDEVGSENRREGHTSHEIIKTPSSSRRYHRTIPRHFTAIDPLISNVKISDTSNAHTTGNANASSTAPTSSTTNKKPTCQCPVQHVPMTYMGSTHFSVTPHTNNVFLSTLSTKLVNCKPNNASIKTTSSSSYPSSGKIQTISKQNIDNLTFTRIDHHSNSGTLKRSHHHRNSSTTYGPSSNGNNHKIATISRHVVELKHDTPNPNTSQIHSILKTPNAKEKNSHNGSTYSNHHSIHGSTFKASEETFNPPFPIQFIDGISKLPSSSAVVDICSGENPVLPPKMHKSANLKQIANPVFVSKIHTITKPNEVQPVPPRTSSASRSPHNLHNVNTVPPNLISNYTKSLPRKEEKISHALTLPIPGGPLSTEKSQSLNKINSTTYYPMQNGYTTYTLPKQNNGKVSLNSTIASVVSKVPSVISIPSSSSIPTTTVTTTISDNGDRSASCNINKTTNNSTNNTTTNTPENHNSTLNYPNVNFIPSESKSPKPLLPTDNLKSTTLPKVRNNLMKPDEKPLPVCTTSKNCSNPKEHFLPNDTSLDDDYLSECENCKTAHSSRYYLDEEIQETPPETMTLQRKMDDKEEEQTYYRTSLTLPTNTKKTATIKNNRETWFSSIPASSSSDEEANE